jgi:hypothetical protein
LAGPIIRQLTPTRRVVGGHDSIDHPDGEKDDGPDHDVAKHSLEALREVPVLVMRNIVVVV